MKCVIIFTNQGCSTRILPAAVESAIMVTTDSWGCSSCPGAVTATAGLAGCYSSSCSQELRFGPNSALPITGTQLVWQHFTFLSVYLISTCKTRCSTQCCLLEECITNSFLFIFSTTLPTVKRCVKVKQQKRKFSQRQQSILRDGQVHLHHQFTLILIKLW